MIPSLRPLSLGEILDGAFALYRRHFVALYAGALLTALPMAAAAAVSRLVLVAFWNNSEPPWAAMMGALLAGSALSCVGWGALLRQASDGILGRPITIGEGVRAGLRAAPALWVQGLVLLVLWSFFTLFSGSGFGAGGMMLGALGPAGTVVGVLISLAAWIAGQLAFCALFFAAPGIVVVERLGPFAAMLRSNDLVRGAIPRTMAAMGVCGLITLLPWMGVGALGAMAGGEAGSAPAVLRQALAIMAASLALPFLAAALSLLYYDRLVREEALDVRLLAEQLVPAQAGLVP